MFLEQHFREVLNMQISVQRHVKIHALCVVCEIQPRGDKEIFCCSISTSILEI
jgi:hypothetical protein